MPRFLVEVPHEKSPQACQRAIDTFLRTGSHFLRRAEWGCKDQEHKAWLIVDVDSKTEARNIVPPDYRQSAKVVELATFTLEDMKESAQSHSTERGS